MVVRQLKDSSVVVSTQEDHAELSAQFAAHWGNREFSQPRPYESVVCATTYHDSGYREWEGSPPINVEKGRPYGHREHVPAFQSVELHAYMRNIEWVESHDLYAGLLVSMHRTGLWQSRYQTLTSPKGRLSQERDSAVKEAIKQLELRQQEHIKVLGKGDPNFTRELWFNYKLLQVYDILSLYFCCDGYEGDNRFREYLIAPVPVAYDSNQEVDLRIQPAGGGTVRITPYPFDDSPLTVSVRARTMQSSVSASEEACRQAYHKARRCALTFEIAA